MTNSTPQDEQAIRTEFYRIADALLAWVNAYDANGKTYGMFWRDFEVEAVEFKQFMQRQGLPDDLLEQEQFVYAFIDHAGLDPAASGASMDDLIIGRQRATSSPDPTPL